MACQVDSSVGDGFEGYMCSDALRQREAPALRLLRKDVVAGTMRLSSAVWTCAGDDNIAFMRTLAASALAAAIR